jgi:hypothetical protein
MPGVHHVRRHDVEQQTVNKLRSGDVDAKARAVLRAFDDNGIYYRDPADPTAWILKRAWLDLVNGYPAA